MHLFQYGQAEIDHLKRRDRKLGRAIDRIGMIERQVMPDLFKALVHSVVAQQISRRQPIPCGAGYAEGFWILRPVMLPALRFPKFKNVACRCARRDTSKESARLLIRGDLDLLELREMPDEGVIEKLSSLPGIGVWTAEMLSDFFAMPAGCRELGGFGYTARHDEFVWAKGAL